MWIFALVAHSAEPPISGTWVLAETTESLKTKHEAAIEAAVGQFPWAIRPVVRSKLVRHVGNCGALELGLDSGTFRARCDQDDPFERPVSGEQAPITGKDGKSYVVELDVTGEAVALTFQGEEGGQRTRYRMEDGQLVLTKEILSSWFESPVAWTVRYRRR